MLASRYMVEWAQSSTSTNSTTLSQNLLSTTANTEAPFAPAEQWPTVPFSGLATLLDAPRMKLDHFHEESHEGSVGLGLSATFGPEGAAFGCSVGASVGGSIKDPEPRLHLIDISGDSIPDRVWRLGDTIFASLGKLTGDGGGCFGPSCDMQQQFDPEILFPELFDIGDEISLQGSVGGSAQCGAIGTTSIGGSLGLQVALTQSRLMDADGDGYLDLVTGVEQILRGLPSACRDGSKPISGRCEDGLKICTDQRALCFDAERLDELASDTTETRHQFAALDQPTLRRTDPRTGRRHYRRFNHVFVSFIGRSRSNSTRFRMR